MSSPLGRWLSLASLALALCACSKEGTRANPTTAGSAAPAAQAGQGGSGAEAPTSGRGGTVAGNAGSPGAGRGGSEARPTQSAGQGAPDDRDTDAGVEPRDAAGPEPDSGAVDGSTPPAVTCPSTALRSGETRAMLMHAGRQREYLIYVPRDHDGSRPVPLVLNFHGATMTATQQRDFSGMNATADAKGFVVVYPQGVGNSWNAGACCGEAQSSNVDDVGFAKALVEAVKAQVCIDPRRIYAAGFSNGGRMSYRLGCELADVFAALAPVAGTKSFPDDQNSPGCKPTQPISLIDFMGSADPRSAAQAGQIEEWVAFNRCTDAQPQETYRQGAHFCSSYSQCSGGTSVTYCVVDGGDHCWPGSYPCLLGNTSRPDELSANELLWMLFERSTR